MKNLLTICGLLAGFSALAQPELPQPYTLKEMGIKGSVKSITTYEYEGIKEDGLGDGPFKYKTIEYFDSDGKMTKTQDFGKDNSTSISTITYDSKGRVSTIIKTENEESMPLKFTYTEEGNTLIRKGYVKQNGREEYIGKQAFIFLPNKKISSYSMYMPNESEAETVTDFYYTPAGTLAKVKMVDILGTTTSLYTYNKDNDLIKETNDNTQKKELDYIKTYKYTYDNNRNWTTQIEDDNHLNSVVKRMGINSFKLIKREIVYY